MNRFIIVCTTVVLCGVLSRAQAGSAESGSDTLLTVLDEELTYTMEHLAMPDGTRPYFMAYEVKDSTDISIGAELGALASNDEQRNRLLDVDIRVGDYKLDNTHQLRGGFGRRFGGGSANVLSLEDDSLAIRHELWLATDREFKSAVQRYQAVQTNLKTKVEEEDQSDDFSREQPVTHTDTLVSLNVDRAAWAERLRRVSALARDYPLIYNSSVSLSASAENRYLVTSEGTRLRDGRKLLRVFVTASTRAEDGMNLSQYDSFDCSTEQGLPTEAQLTEALQKVIDQVLALREAPLVEPYSGPAILVNRASGVFFHEIFGHRIEGHRQKDVEEGQTFTKKIDQPVLPPFISVHDNPTLRKWGTIDLRGYYQYDDEGVPAQDVTLVDKGTLKTFLLSRSPVEGFTSSNGHGRRSSGNEVVSRQGNLVVYSDKKVTFDELRDKLIEECRRQNKPYGLLFEDISGGFTGTRRSGAQTFKVLPIVVYRVYADGRPDELVRGVDIVGTPLTCFSKIIYTADDAAVFNGTCGAESGWVPVSAISPSILVSEIEIEKRRREQDKPPILPPPVAERNQPI